MIVKIGKYLVIASHNQNYFVNAIQTVAGVRQKFSIILKVNYKSGYLTEMGLKLNGSKTILPGSGKWGIKNPGVVRGFMITCS